MNDNFNYIKNKIEETAQQYKTTDLISSSKKISEAYLNNSSNGERLITSKIDVISYAIMRMPATYEALSFSLEKMMENNDIEINSVLDLGSGTGSSIISISERFSNPISFTCVEREKEMINFVKEVVLENQKVEFINIDGSKEFPNVKADLVVASYMINELNKKDRELFLNHMLNASNKYVLIVEPGTPEAFNYMKEIREFFISKGLYLLAPCPHMDKCNNDWCHFQVRVSRSKLHKLLKGGDAPYEDEKFTYLVFSKEKGNTCSSRVLRHPLINKGYITLSLCNKEGMIESKIVSKKDKELFKKARKVSIGDSF